MASHKICMEFIEDVTTIKDYLVDVAKIENASTKESKLKILTKNLGKVIASMHDLKVTHGDLTTSNFLINPSTGQISTIDFGLGQLNSSVEDMAVDLYVLERALLCTHPELDGLVEQLFSAYNSSSHTNKVALKLEEVRMRGRKRTMLG